MGDMGEAYQVVKKKLKDLQEQRTMLLDLIFELFAEVEQIEEKLGEFYESCREASDQ